MITSTQNQTIKDIAKLSTQKDILCLDNPKLIEEAISSGNQLLYVLRTDNAKVISQNDIVVSDNVLKKFTNTITSQGVVALFKQKQLVPQKPKGNFLVMDRLQDPGNVGTLIRSAVGSDFLDIYLVSCVNLTNPKLVRSTMGAMFKARLYEVDENFVKDVLAVHTLCVADMNGENVFETEFSGICGIVVGNEGQGVSQNLKNIANKTLSIPMKNNLESLNAGVSGSIIMYQISNGGKNVRS
ncbi:MAG: RNA methyltransferase [Clostridia bacterium]|nr:RNA methyltransferase [Clostridia bacterium]